MVEKFILESIVIEGFKGFTSPQEIKFNGKSSFIFGPNGWGKSSILEAISWCMFGLDRENESEIRNRDFYRDDCRVEITLVQNEEKWKVIRKLRADSGKSDVKMVSPQGEEKNLTDVFPQLRKLGGIGANVLFAQQGTAHRFVGDLNKFKDVIDAYLGLDRLEKLRKLLLDEEKDRNENHYEKQIKREWIEFEKNIDNKILDVENKLKDISSNSPWEGTVPPTDLETKTKMVSLYKDAGNFLLVSLEDSISTLSMEEILDKISTLLESTTSGGELDNTIKQKKSTRSSLEDMKGKYESLLNDIKRTQNDKQRCETELSNLLSTKSEEELNKRKEGLEGEDNNLRQELESAVSGHKIAEENRTIKLPTIESNINELKLKLDRLTLLQNEISRSEQELAFLTKDTSENELAKRLEELKSQAGKLGEYFRLINNVVEYCSKYGVMQCPICESNSSVLQKLSEKINATPQENQSITQEISSLNKSIQEINEIRGKLYTLQNEREEISRSVSDPAQKMIELEAEKQKIIQEEKTARNKKELLSKEVPEKRNKILLEINSIEQTKEKITSLRTQIQNYEMQLTSFDDGKRKIEEYARRTLNLPIDTEIDLKKLEDAIRNIGSEILNLERELNVKTSGLSTYNSRLKELRREVEYHHLLKLSADLSEFKSGEDWQEVDQLFKEFLELLDSIKEIYDALGSAYTKIFNDRLNAINKKVCKAYKTLTAQVSYPDAKVSQTFSDSGSIEIVIEVGVSKEDIWRKPSEVLNEQAKNAVVLVPYFAFSELGMLQHDLDFLLIDDPSRSFDVKHLESLMKLLKSVSDHAQVILATHEIEKFEKPVRNLFEANANILEVVGFDPKSGPQIKEVSI